MKYLTTGGVAPLLPVHAPSAGGLFLAPRKVGKTDVKERTMTTNEERCGHCGTVNEWGRDRCKHCGQPLTASGENAMRESSAAGEHGGVLAPELDFAPSVEPGMSFPLGEPVVGAIEPMDEVESPGRREGLPQRRS